MNKIQMILGASIIAAGLAPANAQGRSEFRPRAVHLLNFTKPVHDPASGVGAEISPVSKVMLAEFDPGSKSAMTVSATAAASMGGRPDKASSIFVPAWMRVGSINAIPASLVRPLSIGCGSTAYRPLAHVSRTVEARRRLIFPIVAAAACEVGLPVALMDALVVQESGYNPNAVSRAGALGLTQLMPFTARDIGANPYNISENVRGGARYLAAQLKEFGRVDLALAAYNAGPGRVRARRSIPNISETRNYVRTILANWSGVTIPQPSRAQRTPANPFRQAVVQLFTSRAPAAVSR